MRAVKRVSSSIFECSASDRHAIDALRFQGLTKLLCIPGHADAEAKILAFMLHDGWDDRHMRIGQKTFRHLQRARPAGGGFIFSSPRAKLQLSKR